MPRVKEIVLWSSRERETEMSVNLRMPIRFCFIFILLLSSLWDVCSFLWFLLPFSINISLSSFDYHVRGCDFDDFLFWLQQQKPAVINVNESWWPVFRPHFVYVSVFLLSTHLCKLSNIIPSQINPSSIISMLCVCCWMINRTGIKTMSHLYFRQLCIVLCFLCIVCNCSHFDYSKSHEMFAHLLIVRDWSNETIAYFSIFRSYHFDEHVPRVSLHPKRYAFCWSREYEMWSEMKCKHYIFQEVEHEHTNFGTNEYTENEIKQFWD